MEEQEGEEKLYSEVKLQEPFDSYYKLKNIFNTENLPLISYLHGKHMLLFIWNTHSNDRSWD